MTTDNSTAHTLKLLSVLAVCFACILPVTARNPLTFPRSGSANVGIVVKDLKSGAYTVDYNGDRFLTPASITKCITAAAVEIAGLADTRYQTDVMLRGRIDAAGCLYGDIVIKATGDPTVESGEFPGKGGLIDAVSSAVLHRGIREVYGAIVIDSVGCKEQGPVSTWEVGDLRHAYGTGLYALNYKNNAVGQLSLADPGEELLIDLEERMLSDSIAVRWNEIPPVNSPDMPLAQIQSATLAEILKVTLEESNNLYAEAMLRSLAPSGFRADALKREQALLSEAGLDTEAMHLLDGSGLTRANSVTPRFMAELLAYCFAQPWGTRYAEYLPLVGREGTVKRVLADTPMAGCFALKSGSMGGVQTYAGYKLDSNGKPTHAVVIMVNNFTSRRRLVINAIEEFLLREFSSN